MVARGLRHRPQGLMHPHMLEALAGGGLFAVDDEVFKTKLQRIEAKLARDLVDVGLQGKHGLWFAWSTHEAARKTIGVDERRLDPTVWDAIGASRLVIAADNARRFEGRI